MPWATLSRFVVLMASLRNLNRLASTLACGLALLLAACGSSTAPATPTPTPSPPGPALVQTENSILARPPGGWPGAAAGRLRLEHRTGDPHADPQPSRARHGADRKFDPGATAGRGAE